MKRGGLLEKILSASLIVVVSGVALLVVEGGASVLVFGKDVLMPWLPPDFRLEHVQYDAGLGWAHVPGFRSPDYYGPGRGMSVDEEGFRCGSDDCDPQASNLRRVICSGDSFTLGYGVGNADTWCHRLSVALPHIAALNMGQSGYGIDQSYLWYMRDGQALDHEVLLFAFIEDDFRRMGSWRFSGNPKPALEVRDGALVTRNVPVPRSARGLSLRERMSGPVEELGIVRLARRLGLGGATDQGASARLAEISAHVFSNLVAATSERGVETVLVYLPTLDDYGRPGDALPWRDHAEVVADSIGTAFLDLSGDLRALPREEVERLFLRQAEIDFPGAPGHYSEAGNRWVAERVARYLSEVAGLGPPTTEGQEVPAAPTTEG